MKINKLTASFGKLENESLSFHPGLNVIYAPNESGKSTWCAFIRAMLYGIDSSERVRAGYLPDKLRPVVRRADGGQHGPDDRPRGYHDKPHDARKKRAYARVLCLLHRKQRSRGRRDRRECRGNADGRQP